MSSISFDPMALMYGETMGYPPGVAERVAGVVAQLDRRGLLPPA